MPEFFEITLIVDKPEKTLTIENCLLNKLSLKQGDNTVTMSSYELFVNKEIIFSTYHNPDDNFDTIYISIADQIFHEISFNEELTSLSKVVNACFECSDHIKFAVCGYETNINKIEKINTINDINTDFLSQFPITYLHQKNITKPVLNLDAQDIFTLYPVQANHE